MHVYVLCIKSSWASLEACLAMYLNLCKVNLSTVLFCFVLLSNHKEQSNGLEIYITFMLQFLAKKNASKSIKKCFSNPPREIGNAHGV